MSFDQPANIITRWSVVGMEGMWAKMFDPPTTSPNTTDLIAPAPQGKIRPNPVPQVMFALGIQDKIEVPYTVQLDLMHGLKIPTWDGLKELEFFVIGASENNSAKSGTYPGPTLRIPRGAMFYSEVKGKGPPPHTMHWHGLEPTPINDGVGHCSMEIGGYTYQLQPNFMGFYFAHCHRNTMQHFEFGLYHAMIIEAPDAYFGSIASTNPDGTVVLKDPALFPIGGGRDGKRRVACNLTNFPQFPGFNNTALDAPDPLNEYATHPHAMTTTFDVEALMVFDDRDSTWSELGDDARATYPEQGTMPGINDNFNNNPGRDNFAAFNDFNADYWFVTGVPVPAAKGGTGTIPSNVIIPAALNSGIIGTQVSINAATGQTVLVRCLDAAYNSLRLTFPVDIVIIAWDGRALGVAPYGFNQPYVVPANTPIDMTVARRFDALIRETSPITSTIKAEFIDHTSQSTDAGETENIVMTCLVPINIGGPILEPPTFAFIGKVVDQLGTPVSGINVTVNPLSLGSAPAQTVTTLADGTFSFSGRTNGLYEVAASKSGKIFFPSIRQVSCNSQAVTVPDLVISIADFEGGKYSLSEIGRAHV